MFGVTVMNSLLELVTSGSYNGVSVRAETQGPASNPDGWIAILVESGRAGEGRSGQLLPWNDSSLLILDALDASDETSLTFLMFGSGVLAILISCSLLSE